MVDKQERLAAIEQYVNAGLLISQDQLHQVLEEQGIAVTQSTLSRDLSELGVRKVSGRYVFTDQSEYNARKLADYARVVQRFKTCGPHLVVIHTAVGQAQALAVAIDDANESAIGGTLAGDDTIFVATRSRRAQVVALRRFKQWFGEKHA